MYQKDPARQLRSLRCCHVPAEQKPLASTRPTHAYIPELSERLERDRNLCDGARRTARLLAAYTYRRNRKDRMADITVSYLAKATGRCRRTVQRYLRQLERAGYISTAVVASQKSRLCVGLIVRLLQPLFPKHHAQSWPFQLRDSGVTGLSQKQSLRYKTVVIPVQHWALRCMDGVFRSLMRRLPPLPITH